MQRVRVIFLDIDGVLNCKKTPNPRKLPYVVDPRLLRKFKQLRARSRAKVVLSSSWRHDPAGLFSARYWGIHYDDVIPDMHGSCSRLGAIKVSSRSLTPEPRTMRQQSSAPFGSVASAYVKGRRAAQKLS